MYEWVEYWKWKINKSEKTLVLHELETAIKKREKNKTTQIQEIIWFYLERIKQPEGILIGNWLNDGLCMWDFCWKFDRT